MLTEDVELDPCPFCGGPAEMKQDSRKGFIIRCRRCSIRYKQRVLRNSMDWLRHVMIEHWNTREPSNKRPEID